MSNDTKNRLANARNPFQGSDRRVLCLCSAGLLRSPTLAHLLHKEFGFNTRAAGVNQDFALIPVTKTLLYWADEVVCVEQEVASKLNADFGSFFKECDFELVVLAVDDDFNYGDETLKNVLLEQYKTQKLRVFGKFE